MSNASFTVEPKVGIIILNWNGLDDTIECLESLRKLRYGNYNIVLVDNGSINDEGKRLKTLFPEVHLISNKINRGFSGGNNDGIMWALRHNVEYIVNLNNDCIVDKDWLSNLVTGLKLSGYDFGSSRIMFYDNRTIISTDGETLDLSGQVFSLNKGKNKCVKGKRQILYPCGAASIYSAECLQDVKIQGDQFFDELFFAYYEDADLGIRLNMKNYRGISLPLAVVYHKISRASGKRSDFQMKQIERNRLLNGLLNYPLFFVFAGEVQYIIRLIKLFVHKKNNRDSGAACGKPQITNVISWIRIFIEVRIGIVVNFKEIWKDRKERKTKGFVGVRIWDLFNQKFPAVKEKPLR